MGPGGNDCGMGLERRRGDAFCREVSRARRRWSERPPSAICVGLQRLQNGVLQDGQCCDATSCREGALRPGVPVLSNSNRVLVWRGCDFWKLGCLLFARALCATAAMAGDTPLRLSLAAFARQRLLRA